MRQRSCTESSGGKSSWWGLDLKAKGELPAPDICGQWESSLLALLEATGLNCPVPPLGTSKQWGCQPENHRSLGERKQWPKSATTFTNPKSRICKENLKLPQVISPSGNTEGGFFVLLGQLCILLSVFVTVDPEAHHFFRKLWNLQNSFPVESEPEPSTSVSPSPFSCLVRSLFQHSVRIERKTLTNRLCQTFFLFWVLRVEPAKCKVKEVDWRAWEGTSCALGLLCRFPHSCTAHECQVQGKRHYSFPVRALLPFPAPAPTKSYFPPWFSASSYFHEVLTVLWVIGLVVEGAPKDSCHPCLPWPHSWAV